MTYFAGIKLFGIRTVAFSGIGTGVYGYPGLPACKIALDTVRKWLEEPENRESVDLILFCTFMDRDDSIYRDTMPLYFAPSSELAESSSGLDTERNADEKEHETAQSSSSGPVDKVKTPSITSFTQTETEHTTPTPTASDPTHTSGESSSVPSAPKENSEPKLSKGDE